MYALELDRLVEEIKNRGSKRVLVQLPDGLKPRAGEILEFIEKHTDVQAFVWLSSCYGACDIPQGMGVLGIDLIVQFGHNRYTKTVEGW